MELKGELRTPEENMNFLLLDSEFDNIEKLKEIDLRDFEKTLNELEEAGVNVKEQRDIFDARKDCIDKQKEIILSNTRGSDELLKKAENERNALFETFEKKQREIEKDLSGKYSNQRTEAFNPHQGLKTDLEAKSKYLEGRRRKLQSEIKKYDTKRTKLVEAGDTDGLAQLKEKFRNEFHEFDDDPSKLTRSASYQNIEDKILKKLDKEMDGINKELKSVTRDFNSHDIGNRLEDMDFSEINKTLSSENIKNLSEKTKGELQMRKRTLQNQVSTNPRKHLDALSTNEKDIKRLKEELKDTSISPEKKKGLETAIQERDAQITEIKEKVKICKEKDPDAYREFISEEKVIEILTSYLSSVSFLNFLIKKLRSFN